MSDDELQLALEQARLAKDAALFCKLSRRWARRVERRGDPETGRAIRNCCDDVELMQAVLDGETSCG